MPPFRIPFTGGRKPAPLNGLDTINDENARPSASGGEVLSPTRSRPSLKLESRAIMRNQMSSKLSAVNDSGEYLPPSPPEKKSFWHRSPPSANSSNHRSLISENEPFSISRESFESYRRSFDISGRSPILQADSFNSRASLDSRSPRLPRSAVNGHTFERPVAAAEDKFEDVGLNDDPKPKKRSFLSKAFGESTNENPITNPDGRPPSSHHFHIPGRKRGQSGSGNELGAMERPSSKENQHDKNPRCFSSIDTASSGNKIW